MDYQDIIAQTVGEENAYGTCVGRIEPGPMTFARVSTDDLSGTILAYIGEGEFTDDPLNTFGGVGVVHIERMQDLLHGIMARHTGQSADKIADDFDRDYFMDASQAVEYGIIDEVLSATGEQEAETEDEAGDADEAEA